MRTRYPASNFPIYLPSIVLFSCKSCITKFPTVLNLNAKDDNCLTHSGRPGKRTVELIDDGRDAVENSPKISIRKRSQALGITPTTNWRVQKLDLYV